MAGFFGCFRLPRLEVPADDLIHQVRLALHLQRHLVGTGPQVLLQIEQLQHVGVLLRDFALLDLLAVDEDGERRDALVLGAAGRRHQRLERQDRRRGAAPGAVTDPFDLMRYASALLTLVGELAILEHGQHGQRRRLDGQAVAASVGQRLAAGREAASPSSSATSCFFASSFLRIFVSTSCVLSSLASHEARALAARARM